MKRAMTLVLAAAAGSASAQAIVMTEKDSGAIYKLGTDDSITSLYSFGGGRDVRLAGITRGPDGAFYVNNGPLPVQDPSQASVFRITDLLGGSGSASVFAMGDPIQNPIGLVYDAPTNNFFAVNNPPAGLTQTAFDGILGINAGTGAVTEVYEQPDVNDPVPAYRQAARIAPDMTTPGSYLVVSLNGGTFDDGNGNGDFSLGSTLWRLTVDNGLVGTVDLVADMSTFNTGDPITKMRGLTWGPEGELYVTDAGTDSIYRIDFDGSGVDSISEIFSLTPGAGALDIIYQPSTDSLVFSSENAQELWRVGRDGSGATLLASDFEARGFYLVPTPGVLGVLGLYGLAAVRRRR